jgi:hypothetical protein
MTDQGLVDFFFLLLGVISAGAFVSGYRAS